MSDNDGRARMPLFLLTAVVATLVVPARALGWSWPVDGPVLAPFDFDRSHPYDAGQHRGTDIGAPSGSPVAAPVSGSVSFAGSVPSSGKVVTIETADGYSVTLLHLGSYSVRRGQPVEERSVVGTVGLSGEPEQTEPYVHLGIRLVADPQGYLDPLGFLPGQAPVPPPPPQPPGDPPPPPDPAPEAVPGPPAVAPAPTPDIEPAQPPARSTKSRHPAPHRRAHPVTRPPLHARPAAVLSARRAPHGLSAGRVAPRAPLRVAARRHLRRDRAQAARGSFEGTPEARVRVAEPVTVHSGSARPSAAELTLCAALVLAAALAYGRGRARRTAARKPARIIESDALLPDDTDLLRERDALHRQRVHDHRRGRARPSSPAARRRDLLPDRHRRARVQGVPRGRGAGSRPKDVRRSNRREQLA